MLSEKLKQVGCNTIHTAGDADVTIALSATSAATDRETVVIADDTDVLVLLCHHGNRCKEKIFFQPEPKPGSAQTRFGTSRLLVLSSVQTFADICRFSMRYWGVKPLDVCLVSERPLV